MWYASVIYILAWIFTIGTIAFGLYYLFSVMRYDARTESPKRIAIEWCIITPAVILVAALAYQFYFKDTALIAVIRNWAYSLPDVFMSHFEISVPTETWNPENIQQFQLK